MFTLTGNKRRRDAVIAMLSVLCVVLVMTSFAQNRRVKALTNQVSANYHKALYETYELMGGVQLNLEKLMVSSSSAHEQSLLVDLARQADGVQDNLSIMPPGQAALEGAIKYANQVGDFAKVLADRLAGGGSISAEDREGLTKLHRSAASLNEELASMIQAYEWGEWTFEVDEAALERLSVTNREETKPLVDFPVLLYDGPFSDGRDIGAIELSGEPVNATQAAEKLRRFIGNERITRLVQVGESNVFAECYEFEATTESGVLSAAVTKVGGHVLYMLPTEDLTNVKLSQAECIDVGQRFLNANGFGQMVVSYWHQQDGILTINYAAMQDGVILYPDLIKLQLSMENGFVVGMESTNYLRNHVTRTLPEPVLTEEAAMAGLNDALTVEQIRRCVIPLDVKEAQCWEIMARFEGGSRFLIYLDTQTGEEHTILQIVEDNQGIVTQ